MSDWLLGLRFADPHALWLALLIPAALLANRFAERRGRVIVFPGVGRYAGRALGWRARWRKAPLILAALGLLAGVLALARPQKGLHRENRSTEGVDIVVSMDVSGSMAAEDFQPKNRLEVAKTVVADFFERRPDDRIGLVVFAGQALTKSPPTTDTPVLLNQLEDVRLNMLPDGTAIGSGLATALQRLRRSEARSRVVVLVTDGANNAGEIDPETATDIARAMQVRVYTILVGRGGRVPMTVKVQDAFGRIESRKVVMEVDIDEKLLKRIAARTGGEFFQATDSASLRTIFDRIDELEKTEIKLTAFRRYRELYRPLLVAAAFLLALAGMVWSAGLRTAPV